MLVNSKSSAITELVTILRIERPRPQAGWGELVVVVEAVGVSGEDGLWGENRKRREGGGGG